MRHRKKTKILGRPSYQRRMLKRSLAVSLISAERIKTTQAKAKWLRPFVEKCITIAKKKNLPARRQLLSLLNNKPAVNKLFNDLSKRFQDRTSGYTRVTKAGRRQGDGAEMAMVEFVNRIEQSSEKTTAKKSDKDEKKKEKEKEKENGQK